MEAESTWKCGPFKNSPAESVGGIKISRDEQTWKVSSLRPIAIIAPQSLRTRICVLFRLRYHPLRNIRLLMPSNAYGPAQPFLPPFYFLLSSFSLLSPTSVSRYSAAIFRIADVAARDRSVWINASQVSVFYSLERLRSITTRSCARISDRMDEGYGFSRRR